MPCELAGKLISKRLYPEHIEFVFEDQVVASHPRLFDRGHTCYDWRHYVALLERKPGALRNGAPLRPDAGVSGAAAAPVAAS